MDKEIQFNRQVNYLIIEKLWKYKHKNIDDLYTLLGINANIYSRIRKPNEYNTVNLEKYWKEKSGLKKLGLSEEIMTGKKMMEINDIKREEWAEYLKYRYGEKKEKNRNSQMVSFDRKIKEAFGKLSVNEPIKGEIDKLYYFVTYDRPFDLGTRDIEMKDLLTSLNRIDIQKVKVCDKKLREEVCELLKERYEQVNAVIQYNNLE